MGMQREERRARRKCSDDNREQTVNLAAGVKFSKDGSSRKDVVDQQRTRECQDESE
jgi:hypothetical protein